MDEFVFLGRMWVQEHAWKVEKINRNAWMIEGDKPVRHQRRWFLGSRRGE